MTGRGGHPYGAYFWAHPVETLPGTVAAGQSARGAPGGSTTHPGRGVPPSRSCVHRAGVESRVLLRSWPRVVAQPVSEPRLPNDSNPIPWSSDGQASSRPSPCECMWADFSFLPYAAYVLAAFARPPTFRQVPWVAYVGRPPVLYSPTSTRSEILSGFGWAGE